MAEKREDCLSETSFAVPVIFKTAQENSLKANQVNGCLFFWFVFFGQAKKMNALKNMTLKAIPLF
jgi:hypothetical protein